MTCAPALRILLHHLSGSWGPRNDRDLIQNVSAWVPVAGYSLGWRQETKNTRKWCGTVCSFAFPLSPTAPPCLISDVSEITHPLLSEGQMFGGDWVRTFPICRSGPMSKHSWLPGSRRCWILRLASASQLLFELSPDRKIKSGSKESCKQCAMSHLKAADASFGVTCCGWWVWMMWGFR